MKRGTDNPTDELEFYYHQTHQLSQQYSAHKCKTGPTGDHWPWQTSHLQIHLKVHGGGDKMNRHGVLNTEKERERGVVEGKKKASS